jgi:pimeloyl-ACP methyl ester carboxylesterase
MTDFTTSADGLRIAYEVAGEGRPIILIHGFASDRVQNWKAPGWYATLNGAGFKVIALDCRGHGESDKPHDASFYGHDKMASDVIAVMRSADVERAQIMGYSMGGMISMVVLMHHAAQVQKLIIGGVGGRYLVPAGMSEATINDTARRKKIAAALIEPDITKVTDPEALGFRKFAEQAGKDIRALAACMSADRHQFTSGELARSTRPVLVVDGEKDDLAGTAQELALAFADGRGVTVPKRDHMTTVGDKVYKQAVLEFLAS